jgi:site-specific recombinase XerC
MMSCCFLRGSNFTCSRRTHLLKGRADIRQIQKLLGHRRLSSTEVYTRVELSDLAEVIARCHPREKRNGKR